MQILSASGNDVLVLKSVFIGMVIHILLNLILVPKYAQDGAALAIVITELLVTLVTYYYAYQKFNITFNINRLVKDLMLCLIFIPIVWMIKGLVSLPSMVIVFSLSSCAALYITAQYVIFKNEFIDQAILTFKNKLIK
jgi:O-antigen/teichoic acid export membrane protein